MVQEVSVSALASLAEMCGEQFMPYMHPTVELSFWFFEGEKYKAKEYIQLRGKVV
jgi:hypothetical protein